MIVSAVHHADVILRGKRRETRCCYRMDVPIDLVRISPSDLQPGIAIDAVRPPYAGEPATIRTYGGRLWAPYVPQERRRHPGLEMHLGDYGEANAMTEEELIGMAGGGARIGEFRTISFDDPIERIRGKFGTAHEAPWTPAVELPFLEEDDVKTLLWDDRAATERRLRRAADRVMIVDGRIWREFDEPALTLESYGDHKVVRVTLEAKGIDKAGWDSLRHFRLDRMDDIMDWARRQGAAVVQNYPQSSDRTRTAIECVDSYRVLDPDLLRRDDARMAMSGRLLRVITDAADLVGLLPGSAVDAFVALKTFRLNPSESRTETPVLYEHLQTLATAVESLSGLSDLEFHSRHKTRTAISPLLVRWRSHEERLHRPASTPTP